MDESSPASGGHENREGGTLFLVFCEEDGRVAERRGTVFLEGKEVGETDLILGVTLSKSISHIIQQIKGE